MQSFTQKLNTARPQNTIQAYGDLFVYESATVNSGDERIKVKPEGGNEIVLKPGQSFRNPTRANAFSVELFSAGDIEAALVIGSGEFWDSNTNNTVTLDATLTNNVSIMNTPAVTIASLPEVEIKNDLGNPLQVAGTVAVSTLPAVAIASLPEVEIKNDAGNPIQTLNQYQTVSGTWVSTASINVSPKRIITAAQNVNGVLLHSFVGTVESSSTSESVASLLFKTGTAEPTTLIDGTVLGIYPVVSNAGSPYIISGFAPTKIPAGKELWYLHIGSATNDVGVKCLTYTLL